MKSNPFARDDNYLEFHLEPGPDPASPVKRFHECPGCGHRLRYGYSREGRIRAARCEFCHPANCQACGTGPMERGQGRDVGGHQVAVFYCSRCRRTEEKELSYMPGKAQEF